MTLSEVGIFVFDGVEVLDFCGPFEVFSTASKPDMPSTYPEPALFRSRIVAETKAPIRAVGGLEVTPFCTIDQHPLFEILVIPGGFGTRAIYADRPRVTDPRLTASFGAAVVRTCLHIARAAGLDPEEAPRPAAAPEPATSRPAEPADVLVLGGTGFIGSHSPYRSWSMWEFRLPMRSMLLTPRDSYIGISSLPMSLWASSVA